MSFPTGSFHLGPDDASLTVRTGTAGAMAKAGHRLEIRMTKWSARLELADDPAASTLSLEIDSRSLDVIDGNGGAKALTDEDRGKIARIIEDKVLKGDEITFASTSVRPVSESELDVEGQLTLLGVIGPARFTLDFSADGSFSARTEVIQSSFGIEPYSAMMGALKVTDEVGIEIDGRVPATAAA